MAAPRQICSVPEHGCSVPTHLSAAEVHRSTGTDRLSRADARRFTKEMHLLRGISRRITGEMHFLAKDVRLSREAMPFRGGATARLHRVTHGEDEVPSGETRLHTRREMRGGESPQPVIFAKGKLIRGLAGYFRALHIVHASDAGHHGLCFHKCTLAAVDPCVYKDLAGYIDAPPRKEVITLKPNKEIAERLERATRAWETLAPDAKFSGMNLDDFKARVQQSLDARLALRVATDQLIAAQNSRSDTDAGTIQALLLVVNAIKGDPAHGEDSTLYEACGYVRKSERKSGLRRKSKEDRPTAGNNGLN